jgi:hypothetical protein
MKTGANTSILLTKLTSQENLLFVEKKDNSEKTQMVISVRNSERQRTWLPGSVSFFLHSLDVTSQLWFPF